MTISQVPCCIPAAGVLQGSAAPSHPEQRDWIFMLCSKSLQSPWHSLWQISSLPFMAKHRIFPWEATGRKVNRQTLPSVFNAHSLPCASVSHLHSVLSAGATTPQCRQAADTAESNLPGFVAWLESEALCDSSYKVSSSLLWLETPLGSTLGSVYRPPGSRFAQK